LNATVFTLSSSAQSIFKETVAASMPPVLPSSVTIFNTQQITSASSSSRRLRLAKIALTTQNDLVASISYTVSVFFKDLGHSNASLAFLQLSQSLSLHVSNGSFTQTLRRKAINAQVNPLTTANVTSVSLQTYSVEYQTYSPSISPLLQSNSRNKIWYAKSPANILLPVGGGLLLLVFGVISILVLKYYYKCGAAKELDDKSSQKSITYDDIYAAKPKASRSPYRRSTS